MIELPSSLDPEKRRKFWSNPEGKTAMILLAVLGLAALTFWSFLVPFVLTMLQQTLSAILTLAAIIILVTLPFNRKFRFFLKVMVRKLTNLFVKIFPVDILKQHISNLAKGIGNIEEQIGILRGVMTGLQRKTTEQKDQYINLMNTASFAKKSGEELQAQIKARQATKLEQSRMKIDELYTRLEKLMRVLKQYHKIAKIMKEDLEFDVNLLIEERDAVIAGHSAMVNAMNIIGGRGELQEMFDMAMEGVVQDVNRRMGEISNFIDMSEDIINSVNLEQGMVDQMGLQKLEEWEQKGEAILLSDKKQLLQAAEDPSQVLDLNEPLFPGSTKEEVAARQKKTDKFKSFLNDQK
ncbi:MAG: hypothetical protein A2Y94_15315 [Caldithrix sp. RBG_13_44_9]|nr:MAG: hypothetical protein A2Y94_15315 [Caldithrix sp. RBG_13_44_9]